MNRKCTQQILIANLYEVELKATWTTRFPTS